MNPQPSIHSSLPDDIALKIASSLEVRGVCSLGSCSRFWRQLCASDCVWEPLCRDRWPGLALDQQASSTSYGYPADLHHNLQGWRGLYIKKHNEMAEKAAGVVNFVERCLAFESIEVGHYLKAIKGLNTMEFGFKDIQMFFLKPDLNVLLNLVGLHYCIALLDTPAEYLMEVLHSCNISERQVHVQWWKLGRWFYGFRMRDELHSRNISLGDLVTCKDEEVLGVLRRGAVHEVLRIQIAPAKSETQRQDPR
ncbi:PREDICTED: uncharacterized protein LOC109174956 isoform X1 [Ipomoea nil]|uniref:uncharacterized protein LOC109174956 isoform X1 n=1 Tax=Ipomoea nil TaxID=35883 RepID=UPI000901D214|nr:PREDICTED: uncharacterized protein LOC109174956 isoform X1 [Ipomoea nil]